MVARWIASRRAGLSVLLAAFVMSSASTSRIATGADAAGISSVQMCMGCHKIVAAEGNPEVQKLLGYWLRQEPIP